MEKLYGQLKGGDPSSEEEGMTFASQLAKRLMIWKLR
jgi:hypothetical protein